MCGCTPWHGRDTTIIICCILDYSTPTILSSKSSENTVTTFCAGIDLCTYMLASYPGLPVFVIQHAFDKSGRPGR